MQDVALTWEQAAWLTAGLAAVAVGLSTSSVRRMRAAAPFARETTMIAGLYALWQLAGTLSVVGTSGAYSQAEWIERTERKWHLPSEVSVQRAVTGHSAFAAQAANLYYATMHFGMLFVFLVWLFVRHRDRYRPIRRVLALTTMACLLIQLVPVAPPRMLPDQGFVDTAAKYGESVYGLGFGADSLSAMPSVHVAWAVLIGACTLRVGREPWRWLGPLHAAITVLVVVATANHFWADGIVAVMVLLTCAALERVARTAVVRWRERVAAPVTDLSPAADAAILR